MEPGRGVSSRLQVTTDLTRSRLSRKRNSKTVTERTHLQRRADGDFSGTDSGTRLNEKAIRAGAARYWICENESGGRNGISKSAAAATRKIFEQGWGANCCRGSTTNHGGAKVLYSSA